MDALFTADIIVNGENQSFTVTFENERYQFTPTAAGTSFSVMRTHDEWHIEGALPDVARQQAIASLERYLISQH